MTESANAGAGEPDGPDFEIGRNPVASVLGAEFLEPVERRFAVFDAPVILSPPAERP